MSISNKDTIQCTHGLFVIETQTDVIVDVNETATTIYRYSRDELLAMKGSDILSGKIFSSNEQSGEKPNPVITSAKSFQIEGKEYTIAIAYGSTPISLIDLPQERNEELELLVERRTAELARANQALADEIARRQRREDQLTAERQMLRTVIDLLPDYIYVKDRESKFLVNNLAVAQNQGLTPEEVIGKTDFDFFSNDLAKQYYDDEQKVIQTGNPLISREELNYYPLTKTWGWHLTTTVPLRDSKSQIVGIVGVSRNITDHKRAEEALRENIVRQRFAHQLIESQEHERKRIAAELHDSLGQTLLLATNKLYLALRAIGQNGNPSGHIEEALAFVSQTLQEVRDISHNLRPHHIDELGLTKSIESMARRLSETSDLAVEINIEPFDGHISPESEINLYRIAQESLNNILKHSEATTVEITMSNTPDHLKLCISDNGKGFDTDAKMKRNERRESFGLMVMDERARMIGADLHINSKSGEGTTISISLPLTGINDES
jgi:PAS domain S-box-containing protein